MRLPRLFTIDPGLPFLATLARAVLDGEIVPELARAKGPRALAAATVYVPTRRAAAALRAAFVAEHGGALLLPRIVPLGAMEDSDAGDPPDAAGFSLDGPGVGAAAIPLAIDPLTRRMELMRLVLAWGRSVGTAIVSVDADGTRRRRAEDSLLVATTPADAWMLAGELARLIDDLIVEGVDSARLTSLNDGQHDDYWRITLDFLSIALDAWPRHLREQERVDPPRRQALLVERDIARIEAGALPGPVIVAGSTGTQTQTARLMAAIARGPQGALVLPGLDTRLDARAYAMIGGGESESAAGEASAGHPQAAMKRLLERLGAPRDSFRPLGTPTREAHLRGKVLSEAMRPANATFAWRDRDAALSSAEVDDALAGVTLIEAAHEGEEALALAIALREALETPGRTAALVTPDRGLARRVGAELLRWDIRIDDSAGEPLARCEAGALAALALDAAERDASAGAVLALLAHPLVTLGVVRDAVAALLAALEIGLLRGPLPPGLLHDPAALVAFARDQAAHHHAHPARAAIADDLWPRLRDLLERLYSALAPLSELDGGHPLGAWLAAHARCVAALTRGPPAQAPARGPDQARLDTLFFDAGRAATRMSDVGAQDYRAFFQRLAAEAVLAPERGDEERIAIYGLLEARLLPHDLVLLGGLDESVWPPVADPGPFLNRPMRAALGLSPPERRIGQTAHDFVAALGAREVILSRAGKRGGSPMVASRFLQRLAAFAGANWDACRCRGARLLGYARRLDHGDAVPPIERPRPTPALPLRPTRFSVTQIETLLRDPYAIYARRILRLEALDGLGVDFGPRDFGNWMHDALRRFGEEFGHAPLPPEAAARLIALARECFAPVAEQPDFRAFHWPRFERGLRLLHAWEVRRRTTLMQLHVESPGVVELALADGSICKLSARADRIEVATDGAIAIIDYKTGAMPKVGDVAGGYAPQLLLEAALALRGGFEAVPAGGPVAEMLYVKLGGRTGMEDRHALGNKTPKGEGAGKRVKAKTGADPGDARADLAALIDGQFDAAVALLDRYRDPAQPYASEPDAARAPRHGDYRHLARVKEWSTSAGEGDGLGDEEDE